MTVRFEDKATYDTAGYYTTNEEPEVHRELLRGIRVRRAAAIASGGEVALFSVLPHVSRELVLIDHSYQSMAMAMAKAMLLESLGTVKIGRASCRERV